MRHKAVASRPRPLAASADGLETAAYLAATLAGLLLTLGTVGWPGFRRLLGLG